MCADIDPFNGSVLLNSYSLDVSIPLSSGMTIGVGYVVTGNLTLSADLALSGHFMTSLPKSVDISSFMHQKGASLQFRLCDYSTRIILVQDFFLFICYNNCMLVSKKNDQGVITIDDGLFFQLLNEALRPWEGKARYVGEKELRYGEDGLFMSAALSIRIGNSISEICNHIIDFTSRAIEEDLELEVEDIVINVIQMTTARTAVKRDIRFSYRGGKNEEN